MPEQTQQPDQEVERVTAVTRTGKPRIERLAVGPDGIPEVSRELPAFDTAATDAGPADLLLESGPARAVQALEALEMLRDGVAAAEASEAAGVAPADAAAEAAAAPDPATRRAGEARRALEVAEAAGTLKLGWPFVDRRERPRETERIERAANVAIATVGLIVAAPIMALVALAVSLDSRGPVFYTQERVGRDARSGRERRRQPLAERTDRRRQNYTGRVFTIYKFRTMCVDAEKCGAQWAQKNDPRVTRLGRFLRVSRLDELPQLWNVLRGDMNIVGPRPERPVIIVDLVRQIEEYPARHRARPGITGLAQITAAYDSSIDDVRRKVRYDLDYLERRSLLMDLKIMAKTVPVMLFKKMGW